MKSKKPIFICFSSKDLATALRVIDALERDGLPCWISARDVLAGQNYQEQIVRTLENAGGVIFLFSENSSQSPEIRKELSIAASLQIPVFPLRLSEIIPAGALRYELATRQWIDLFPSERRALATLIATIKKAVPTGIAPAPMTPDTEQLRMPLPMNNPPALDMAALLPAGTEGFEAIRTLLARHIGPIAKVLMQKAAQEATSPNDFCERLAAHITAEAERRTFLQAAQIAARRLRS